MAGSVYKIIELVGTSEVSWEEAAKTAVETAGKKLKDLRVGEITKFDMKIQDGKVTAGNAPGLNDGAAAVIVSSRGKAAEIGVKPIARIVGYGQSALAPKYLFDTPSKAIPRLLEKVGWDLRVVDLIELNEAFASQSLACLRQLGLPDDADHVNANGGAIAIGHPLGMSGARLVTTGLRELERRDGRRLLTTMCIGVGQGIAMLLERV